MNKYGRLTPIKEDPLKKEKWLFRCDCGQEKSFFRSNVTMGKTKSCGCLRREVSKSKRTTHGATAVGTERPEYGSWLAARARCTNPKNSSYSRYGGAGIKMCDEWINDPLKFFSDMGPRPTPNHSLDRIDSRGDYCPENCRWATKKEQSRNCRTNKFITLFGERLCLAEATEKYGIPARTIENRILSGLSEDQAVSINGSRPRRGFLSGTCSKHSTPSARRTSARPSG